MWEELQYGLGEWNDKMSKVRLCGCKCGQCEVDRKVLDNLAKHMAQVTDGIMLADLDMIVFRKGAHEPRIPK